MNKEQEDAILDDAQIQPAESYATASSDSSRSDCSVSNGSMYNCWAAFMDIRKDRKHEFPTYECWICSNDPECRSFRQGWAARWKTEVARNYYPDPIDSPNTCAREAGPDAHDKQKQG
jgi:hypothetical protein